MTTLDDHKLDDEQGRLAALHRYEVLDTQPEESFDRITKLVKMVLNVPVAAVTLIDNDRQWTKSCVGLPDGNMERGLSFCTHTIQTHEPMNIPDALLDPRFADNPIVSGPPFVRSYLGAPLMTPDGYNVGALCAIDHVPHEFTAEQAQVLANFASLVVDELELRRIAQTDHLTGAATRRGFVHELDKQIARMKRNLRPSALIMIDVDHFKNVNDSHGHPTGDAVLRNLAEIIRLNLRQGDMLGRLGGEEFAVLLPDTDLAAAVDSAERLREAVASIPLVSEPTLSITISLGVTVQQGTLSTDQWLATSDKALYEAKSSGRNQVCVGETDGIGSGTY